MSPRANAFARSLRTSRRRSGGARSVEPRPRWRASPHPSRPRPLVPISRAAVYQFEPPLVGGNTRSRDCHVGLRSTSSSSSPGANDVNALEELLHDAHAPRQGAGSSRSERSCRRRRRGSHGVVARARITDAVAMLIRLGADLMSAGTIGDHARRSELKVRTTMKFIFLFGDKD